MQPWFMAMGIPFEEGTMDQDMSPEGEWIQYWDLPEGIVLVHDREVDD